MTGNSVVVANGAWRGDVRGSKALRVLHNIRLLHVCRRDTRVKGDQGWEGCQSVVLALLRFRKELGLYLRCL